VGSNDEEDLKGMQWIDRKTESDRYYCLQSVCSEFIKNLLKMVKY